MRKLTSSLETKTDLSSAEVHGNNNILTPLTRRHYNIIAAKYPMYSIGSPKRGKLEDGAIIIVQGIIGMN